MATQLGLFEQPRTDDQPAAVAAPPAVLRALERGALLAISVSGGKDSQAMLEALVQLRAQSNWPGQQVILHADLKRAEWPQTPGHVRFMADRVNIPLTVVQRPQGDLLDEIEKRVDDLMGQDTPVWPDSMNRYCTSDQKRAQLDKAIRNPWPTSSMRYCTADQKRDQMTKVHRAADGGLAVAAIGMRAQEGCRTCRVAQEQGQRPGPHRHKSNRAKRPVLSVNKRVSSTLYRGMTPEQAVAAWTPGKRLVLDWLPIHEWDEDDVWRQMGYSLDELERRRAQWKAGEQDAALKGWTAHPAYVIGLGNKRLSCSLCILGCESDLENGGRYNPELLRSYLSIEARTGWSFQQAHALADLQVSRDLFPELASRASAAVQARAAGR